MDLDNATEVEILPSIITASYGQHSADWRKTIAELQTFKIRRCALFLTGLDHAERNECYRLLLRARKSAPFTLPFVHARNDMAHEEYLFLATEFGADRFNLHPTRRFPLLHVLGPELRRKVFIENDSDLTPLDFIDFAGICLDLSHLEAARNNAPERYAATLKLIQEYEIGANHLSAIRRDGTGMSTHWLENLSQLDYLEAYPKELFGRYAALELVNPLALQLKAISRIRGFLDL